MVGMDKLEPPLWEWLKQKNCKTVLFKSLFKEDNHFDYFIQRM